LVTSSVLQMTKERVQIQMADFHAPTHDRMVTLEDIIRTVVVVTYTEEFRSD